MTSNTLIAQGIRVEYPGVRPIRAVDGVNLRLEPGGSIGVVGESGSGKSTLARSMLGLLPNGARIVDGQVWWDEQDLTTFSRAEMRALRGKALAFVPQASMNSLNPVLTLRAQFNELLRVRADMRRDEAAQRSHELCDLVGVDVDRLVSYPHQLSGGMRQRMVLAMALALEPRVLIADEATTGLDTIIQDRILKRLIQLQRERRFALMYVSHDFGLILAACERIAVMYAGKVVETGPTVEVHDSPWHPYTMGLKNAIPQLRDRRPLATIPGVPVDLSEVQKGCRFAPRCPFAEPRCYKEEPPLVSITPEHSVACHLTDQVEELRIRAADNLTWSTKDSGPSQ